MRKQGVSTNYGRGRAHSPAEVLPDSANLAAPDAGLFERGPDREPNYRGGEREVFLGEALRTQRFGDEGRDPASRPQEGGDFRNALPVSPGRPVVERAARVETVQFLDQARQPRRPPFQTRERCRSSVRHRRPQFLPDVHAAGLHQLAIGRKMLTVARPTPARTAISDMVVGPMSFSSCTSIVALTIRSRVSSLERACLRIEGSGHQAACI